MVGLVISIIANIYLVSQNITLSNQTTTAQARIDMTATLTGASVSIDAELIRIGSSLVYASNSYPSQG